MDRNRRIEELEEQVRHLSALVESLLSGKPPAEGEESGIPSVSSPAPAEHERGLTELVTDVRLTVDRALGGEAGELLETRIGGIWLSRIMVVTLMTTIALGAATTFTTDELGPWQKVLIGYGLAAAGMLYGAYYRASANPFPNTILGAGLAILYYTTYAGFFVPAIHVFAWRWAAIPALFACLILLAAAAHWQRSQATAGIALFLVYYTVVVGCTHGLSGETVVYALLTCAGISVVAFVFHALHRWMAFNWLALIAAYATYVFYFLVKPSELAVTDNAYFWLSNGFITLCYLLFSLACVIEARKTGEYRRFVAPLAGINSFIYFTLTWLAIRKEYPEQEWAFQTVFALCLGLFALFAETTGPRRNYLFQVFIAKAVILLTLALCSLLAGEQLLIALAVECLALALAYQRSGVVIFKILDHLLMLTVFVWCIFSVKLPGATTVGPYVVPANWLGCVGVVTVFAFVAWFYERFAHGVQPEGRTRSGQWFLADTLLDVHNTTAAMLHATAGALILLTITIIDRGDDPMLPYLLAGEAIILAVAGFLLRTPQVEVASVLLLVAAHIAYHFFLVVEKPGFEDQAAYPLYTALVAGVTYYGAYLWERYLRRVPAAKPWEHDLIASVPYLVATFMLTTLLGRSLPGIHGPLAQNALGVTLLLIGTLLGLTAVKASGILALGIGTGTFFGRLYFPDSTVGPISNGTYVPVLPQDYFVAYLALLLFTYAAGERLFVILQHQEREPSRLEDHLRSVLVLLAGILGALALREWSDKTYLTLYWLGHGVAGMALGALFRERRYRWTALLLIAIAVGRAFWHDMQNLPNFYKLLSFTALTAALFIVSWAYSRYRSNVLRELQQRPGGPRSVGAGREVYGLTCKADATERVPPGQADATERIPPGPPTGKGSSSNE